MVSLGFFSCAHSIDQNVIMYRTHTFQVLQGVVELLEFFWRWAYTKWQTTPSKSSEGQVKRCQH